MSLYRVLICWMSLCWMSLRWMSLCWMSLHIVLICWMSLCWISLCWMSLCWMLWRRFYHIMPCHYFAMATVTTNGKECTIFSLIIEGTTEKVSQFITPMKSIWDKNFFWTKIYLWTVFERFKQKYHIINVVKNVLSSFSVLPSIVKSLHWHCI